ncbi:MAG: hypothetical protein LLG13_06495 [Bacteroidales bacterium]|nr:hypothetical protein [Bacteroidales bacterium]
MKKLKMITGITWAFAGLILMFILFPGMNNLSMSVSKLPFMKINPNYNGGVVAKQIVEASCTLDIRKPVFDGLLKERKSGFVQIDWRGTVPDNIVDTIDYDLDEIPDFTITIDRIKSTTSINAMSSKVLNIGVSTPTSYGWAVRVNLKK